MTRPLAPVRAPLNAREAREKYFPRMPRNPLKSLDSNERIQGNPRKSNSHNRGVSLRNDYAPRKPKRLDWANVVARSRGVAA